MIVDFGEFLPDLPDSKNPGCTVVKNVLPASNSYRPLASLAAYSSTLTARCQGVGVFKNSTGLSYNYAGDATKLYQLNTAVYSSRSTVTFATGVEDFWEFVQWGDMVVATNGTDTMQTITMGGTVFADLGGGPPKAKHIDVVGDFLVAGNTVDSVNGTAPDAVRWSAFNNNASWTYSPTTQSDSQILLGNGGAVQRIIGGEYGVIFQERAIVRMTYAGPPVIFDFKQVEFGKGTPAPMSVIKVGALIYYLGWDDFYVFDGVRSTPLGVNKVAKWFYSQLDQANIYRVTAAADAINPIIMWGFPSTSAITNCDMAIAYNWATNRFSYAQFNHEMLNGFISEDYTLEAIGSLYSTLEDIPYSLDSRLWLGGKLAMSAFNTSHQLANFTGTHLTAVFETSDLELTPGMKTTLKRIRPRVEGGRYNVQIGTRNSLQRDLSWTHTLATSASNDDTYLSGWYGCRSTAQYHRIRTTVSYDASLTGFTDAMGVELIGVARGGR